MQRYDLLLYDAHFSPVILEISGIMMTYIKQHQAEQCVTEHEPQVVAIRPTTTG